MKVKIKKTNLKIAKSNNNKNNYRAQLLILKFNKIKMK